MEKQLIESKEKSNASLIHLSSLASYIIPFGSLILPIVLWQAMKKESPYIDKHGKSAVNFNISFFLYNIIAVVVLLGSSISTIITLILEGEQAEEITDLSNTLFSIGGLITALIVLSSIAIVKLILVLVATIKAGQGETYKYPLTIPFFK